MRRATCYSLRHSASCWHFYPRSPCGERHKISTIRITREGRISIHALLAESDNRFITSRQLPTAFLSTLSLRRATTWQRGSRVTYVEFLSTLSLRRATIVTVGLLMFNLYFYPRSPCGERLTLICPVIAEMTISIHALLAESDLYRVQGTPAPKLFLSTLSLRRATRTL